MCIGVDWVQSHRETAEPTRKSDMLIIPGMLIFATEHISVYKGPGLGAKYKSLKRNSIGEESRIL